MGTDTMPIFNRETMLERMGGDEELLQDVVQLFLDESPNMLQRVQLAVGASDSDQVEKAAHSMKGAVLNLAADPVAQLAYELEQMGREGNLDRSQEVLTGLERNLDQLLDELRDLLAQAG